MQKRMNGANAAIIIIEELLKLWRDVVQLRMDQK